MTFCVVDLETTGLSTDDAITEIGAVKVRGGVVQGEFQTFVNPGEHIPASVQVLNGITDAMVSTAPRIGAVLPSWIEFSRGVPSSIIASVIACVPSRFASSAAVPASKKAGVAKSAEETGNLPKVEDNEDWVEEEHEKLNPVSILLMIVAGILLAIVIFKGFEILWDNFPRLVVAVLALCVTAIMVGVTHALRTARDGFSMFLAGFTGLVLTFGPLLLVML